MRLLLDSLGFGQRLVGLVELGLRGLEVFFRVGVAVELGLGLFNLLLGLVYRVLGVLRIGSGGVRLRVGRVEFALRLLGRGLLLLVGGLLLVGLVLGL